MSASLGLFALLICSVASSTRGEYSVEARTEPGPARCNPGCKKWGNCGEDGHCRCPFGRLGEDCEVDFLAPCRQFPESNAICGDLVTKSCECMKRCKEYFCRQDSANVTRCEYHEASYEPKRGCYERQGVPPDKQYSRIPEETEKGVAFRWWSDETKVLSREDALKKEEVVSLPLSKCPRSCSKRGYCIATEEDPNPRCMCSRGYKGERCETAVNHCYLQCSGRGKCKDMFCHCQPPYFSIGCSRSTIYPANHSRPSPVNFKIYMYELNTQLAFENTAERLLFSQSQNHNPTYAAYQKFLEQFLLSPVRTEDPSEASLFFIPAFTLSYSSNIGTGNDHLNLLLDHIRMNHPWWNRTGGRDHFLWVPADRGACNISDLAWAPIKIAHFGMHTTPTRFNQAFGHVGHPEYGCFNPLKDVLAVSQDELPVPLIERTRRWTVDDVLAAKAGSAPRRGKLFVFAGDVRFEQPDYSGGTRQLLFNLTQQWEDPDISFIPERTHNYEGLLRASKFCLAPYGHGWGNRLMTAVLSGCVPVIVQEHVWQPFEELLPYDRFSVRLSNEDLPFLREILRGISEQQYRGMVEQLLRYHQAFSWDAHLGGRAFDYTIEALRLRYRNLKAKMF